MHANQVNASIRDRSIFAVYDRTGYLYGLYAARPIAGSSAKAVVRSRLRNDDPDETEWRIIPTTIKSIADEDDIYVLN